MQKLTTKINKNPKQPLKLELCYAYKKSSPTQGYSQYPSFQTFHHFWSILHSCLKAVVERAGSPTSGIRWLTTSSIPFSSQNFFFSGE